MSVAGVAAMLVASGESSPNVSPRFVPHHARQTKRSGEIIAVVGRALGGRPGQRLMSRLGMPLSADTLIRQVKRAARRSALPQLIRVLGVDDWAWCKGQTFGTILVDLERSQVVDLLPTRSADSLGEWLAQHPEVTTVSRDRQGVYAEGARRGAPEAVQVADRFHLVLNLTQAVERELAVNRRHLRIASPSAPALPPSPTTEEVKSQTKQIRVRSSIVMQQMEVARQRRQQKLELFRTIKQMRAAGMKVSQIARQLGLCRRRIDKWIQLDELPERNRMQPRPGMPESFRDYLRQRWEAGCRHGRTLFAEIRKLGYVGCYSGLAKFLSPWRQPKAETRRAISAFPDAPQLEATTLDGIKTTFAAGGGGAVEQGTRRVNQPAGADRRHSEAAVPWLRCHAQAGFWFSRDPARGQGDHPASLDGAGAQDRYPFTGALCADFETGPKRSGSGGEQTMEQRAGRGTT